MCFEERAPTGRGVGASVGLMSPVFLLELRRMGLGVEDEEDEAEAACFSAFPASYSSLFALTKSSSLKIWEWDDMLGGFCGWWSISMFEAWFMDELFTYALGPASDGGCGSGKAEF